MVFIEIMADFVKDESNVWWLVNVKGFQLEPVVPLPKLMTKVVSSIIETPEVDEN